MMDAFPAKGSKMMSQYIESKGSKLISKYLKSDEKIEDCGIGPYGILVLTNQRIFTCRTPLFRKPHIDELTLCPREGEKNICLSPCGDIFTNQRLIALESGRNRIFSIKNECSYTVPDEKYIAFLYDQSQWGVTAPQPYMEPADSKIQTEYLILTDKALKSYHGKDRNFEIIDTLPLSNIEGVDFSRAASRYVRSGQVFLVLSDGNWRGFNLGLFKERGTCEKFPKEISKAAHAQFAPPVIVAQNKKLTEVGLYTKIDLKWPSKCAQCMIESQDITYKRFKISKNVHLFEGMGFGVAATTRVGQEYVEYDVPYCKSCTKEKAVRNAFYDGIRAKLQFNNKSYAEEFVEINSTQYLCKQA
ncbi:MAG: hypothetical protein ACYS3N_07975 [Planctomycetota bacterium]|jgi:hypothetical protein